MRKPPKNLLSCLVEMRFQERLQFVFAKERARRRDLGTQQLTKTDLWKARQLSSGAVSHWFIGGNDADLASCIKIAGLLRCDAWWLYDESGPAPGSSVVARIDGDDRLPPEIYTVVELMQKMCPAQRGEVLGYARRVAEAASKIHIKANGVR